MGFHYTGTPILGMSRRVAEGDPALIETFHNIYKLSDDVIATFVEPVKIASYFHREIREGMKEMGYSVDWRREFTTIDPVYSLFISWQFRTLQKKGLIVRGSHPVGWCPRDQNPVSQHDTMGDVEPDFTEYTIIKFRLQDAVLPAATLRPETIFGVTNMWINPDIEYLRIRLDDKEEWIVSREAARKLEFLNWKIKVISPIRGEELVGKNVVGPVGGRPIPVYPASFVEADSGTGVVMSVPAHAPFDFHALFALKSDKSYQSRFEITADIDPIKIVESDLYSGIPAEEAIQKASSSLKKTDNALEQATSDLYSHEFYKGKMMSNTGKFAGMTVADAKVAVREMLLSEGKADGMYELNNKPVRCRCGAECVVKILSDQWFLNYGDKEWKQLAHECISKMDIAPEEIRHEFGYVIDWLKERACARKTGLGTPLPWDREWIVESLSDSVIYMAYYILAKYVNSGILKATDRIGDSFFDYVLLGTGDPAQIGEQCGLDSDVVARIRTEFSYFYPVDSRHSGRDLVPNHLTFFVFNHVAIFPRNEWPRQIVVNGSVLMDGKKMSKSLGNIIPLRAAIAEHGADVIRLAMLVSAELLQDADFSFDTARGIRSKLAGIFALAATVKQVSAHNVSPEAEDRWLLSRLQSASEKASSALEKLRVREAVHAVLYSMEQDLQWYQRRITAKNRAESETASFVIREFLQYQVRMLAPFAPFTAEELWERMGNAEPVTKAGWPALRHELIDDLSEERELLLVSVIADIQNILKVTKLVPKKIVLYVSAAWKLPIYTAILSSTLDGRKDFGETMKSLISNPETAKAKSDPGMVKKILEDVLSAPMESRKRRAGFKMFDEAAAIRDGAGLISQDAAKAEVLVYSEEDPGRYDPKSKAKLARPFKPAIYIEN